MHTRSSILLLVLACGLAVTSATVMDTIDGSSTHSTLETLIDAADLRDTLAGSTNYTVFAPTDNAFGNLSASTLTCLKRQENQGLLADLLKYHVVAGWVTSSMLTDGQAINSIASTKWFTTNTFTFAAAGLTLTAGSSTETSRVDPGMIDLRSGNGVVHSINHPLIPAGFYCPESVVDVVVNSQVHNRLESLVAVAGLAQTLSTAVTTAVTGTPASGYFTVFAPTDEAINTDIPAAMLAKFTDPATNNDWAPLVSQILLNHVLAKNDAAVLAANLPAAAEAFPTRAAGTPVPELTVSNVDGGTIAGNDISAKVVVADLNTPNGVVHAIDKVLLPPIASRTITDVVVASPDHETLEELVVAASLETVLAAPAGVYTVFAPTNDAFQKVDAATRACLLQPDNVDLLGELLKYHVHGGIILASQLPGFATTGISTLATTFTGNNITVANISAIAGDTDMWTNTGIVHSIDTVLVPAGFTCTPPNTGGGDNTVFDIISDSASHAILEDLLTTANLATTLGGTGPFTVFAPTDAAFAAVDEETLECLQADGNSALLRDVLLYHVHSGDVASTALPEIVPTMSESFTTNSIPSTEITGHAGTLDNDATNGVVHVVTKVFLPEGFVCPAADTDSASSFSASTLLIAGFLAALAAVQARF